MLNRDWSFDTDPTTTDETYAGSESMNSLKHLRVPVIAVGAKAGDQEVRMRQDGILRKVFLTDGRIVEFRLAGDIRGAAALRSLMLRGLDLGPNEDPAHHPGIRYRRSCIDRSANWLKRVRRAPRGPI